MQESNQSMRTREEKQSRILARKIAIVAAVVIILVPLIVGIFFYSTSNIVKHTIDAVTHRTIPPDKAFPGRGQINVLLLGRDIDLDRYGQRVNTRARSDTMILMRFDFAANQLRLLSIPRDTATRIPGYRGLHKINAAHALGGPDLAVQTVHDLIGVPVDYYVVVNYHVLARTIDRLGGVTVFVDKDLDYDDNWGNLHIHLKKGEQTLSGSQAIGFARFRHSNTRGMSDSDFTRMGRQQRLLQALRQRLTDPRVLMRVPGALDEVQRDLVTTLSTDQLISLAYFAKGVPKEMVTVNSLPAREGPVFVYMDRDKTRDLVSELFGIPALSFPSATAPSELEIKHTSDLLIKRHKAQIAAGAPVSEGELDTLPAAPEIPVKPDFGPQPTPTPAPGAETPAPTPIEKPAPSVDNTPPAPAPDTAKPAPTPALPKPVAPQPEAPKPPKPEAPKTPTPAPAPAQGGANGNP